MMAKQGQHKHDANDPRISKGSTTPSKSQTITAGTPKKQETYREQAREGRNTDPQPQAAARDWREDTREEPTSSASTRARHPRSGRSGSDSNAAADTRGH
jgi:hypothetical protein